jgi:hypothetical protein
MSDVADMAQRKIEVHAAASLGHRKPEGPKATGACLWCAEPLPPGTRWCGAECRDGWERETKLRGASRG